MCHNVFYDTDCTDCPAGVTCNDVTGCTGCSGSYPPDCKTSNVYCFAIIILYQQYLHIKLPD